MRPRSRTDFAIAIICALPLEADAVESLFDETYDRFSRLYGKQLYDTNAYINGRIGNHNVVLCYMPGMGKETAASVASTMRISYPGIHAALVVGICGGAPSPSHERDIYLGDVVISDSVVAYDFGRQYPGGFQKKTSVKDTLGRPNQEIRSLLAALRTTRSRAEFQEQMAASLHTLQRQETRWQHPGLDDVLFEASYLHRHRASHSPIRCACSIDGSLFDICDEAPDIECDELRCSESQVVRRRCGKTTATASMHIGTIASADTVMKSGEHRDIITKRERVIAFEMEGAGVWDSIPCIIVKGVCDYADSHKSKKWQCYAAATGASAAKTFLAYWSVGQGDIITHDEALNLQSLSLRDSNDDMGSWGQGSAGGRALTDNSQGNSLVLSSLTQTHDTGVSLLNTEDYNGAEKLLRSALQGREEALGAWHLQTLDSMHYLGHSLAQQDQYIESEQLFYKAYKGRQTKLGTIHQNTLESLAGYANSLFCQGRHMEGERHGRKLLELQTDAFGSTHPNALASMCFLSGLLLGQQKYQESAEILRVAYERCAETLGVTHKNTLEYLDGYTNTLIILAAETESKSAAQEMLQLNREAYGDTHVITLRSMDILGQILLSWNEHAKASELFRSAYQGRAEKLGAIHEDTLSSAHRLGSTLLILDKSSEPQSAGLAEAREMFQRAVDGRERSLGRIHRDTLASLDSLGQALGYQQNYWRAEDVFRDVCERRRKILGEHHEDTLCSLSWLGWTFERRGKFVEAGGLYRCTWEGLYRTLGEENRSTKMFASRLWNVGEVLGRGTQSHRGLRGAIEQRK
ncbi:unnamed protein product [Penicillium olsonii]|nr:unnamed protein product [Penicillium olsonii]